MHLEQMPDMGATSFDRLNVPVASSELGLLKFILTPFKFLNECTRLYITIAKHSTKSVLAK
jgi:hypothetical protein